MIINKKYYKFLGLTYDILGYNHEAASQDFDRKMLRI